MANPYGRKGARGDALPERSELNDSPQEFLSVTQFAALAGCSISKIRYYEKRKLFQPARRGIGTYRRSLYSRSQLLDFLTLQHRAKAVGLSANSAIAAEPHLATLRDLDGYDEPQACRVFELLHAKTPLSEIVITTKLHPRVVKKLAIEYGRIDRNLIITADVLERIIALPLDGPMPANIDAPMSGEDLLKVIVATLERMRCVCKRGGRSTCTACVRETVKKAVIAERVEIAKALAEVGLREVAESLLPSKMIEQVLGPSRPQQASSREASLPPDLTQTAIAQEFARQEHEAREEARRGSPATPAPGDAAAKSAPKAKKVKGGAEAAG